MSAIEISISPSLSPRSWLTVTVKSPGTWTVTLSGMLPPPLIVKSFWPRPVTIASSVISY